MREKRPKRNALLRCVLGTALSCFAFSSLLALPEAPSIYRTVTEIEGTVNEGSTGTVGSNAIMTRPHIPVNHTTADGRVGLDMKPFTQSGEIEFYLYRPENITTSFIDSPNNGPVDIIAPDTNGVNFINYDTFISEIVHTGLTYDDGNGNTQPCDGEIRHVTIIDKTLEFDDDDIADPDNNPSYDAANGDDIYNLTIYATADWLNRARNENHPSIYRHLKMQMTPVEIRVANPKTANAFIRSIVVDPTGTGKTFTANYLKIARLFENKFTSDGKLMVARVGIFTAEDPTYFAPDGQPGDPPVSTNFMDVVYAYSSDGSLEGADGLGGPDGFENVIPISYAPYDPRINGTRNDIGDTFYPFAAFPFRDGSGTLIPKGADFGGSYPWVDTDGRTLSMSTVGASLFNEFENNPALDQDLVRDRYPNRSVDGIPQSVKEDTGPFVNHSIVGLWTQGKLVAMDNSLNNIDYGLGKEVDSHTILTAFYDAVAGETGTLAQTEIRIGSGRDNNNVQLYGGAGNTTFIDTIENKFNFNENLKPVMPRDVVWWMSNGRSTAQFAFDDYLNIDSFIVSKMTGALDFLPTDNGSERFDYHDGWDGTITESPPGNFTIGGFTQEIYVANDATAVGDDVANAAALIDANTRIVARWNIPEKGRVSPIPSDDLANDPRLEPIAHGGIEGKGMWLEQNMSITYAIPAQPASVVVGDHSWYVGIFVDSREDDTTERRLITFPDNTYITLQGTTRQGRETLRYRDSLDSEIHTIDLNQFDTWERNEWRHLAFQISPGGQTVEFYHNGMLADIASWASGAMFQMNVGDLIVGATSGTNGYRGWFDDFKVFGQAFGPEVCANLARGTLVAIDPSTLTVGLAEHDAAFALVAQADLYVAGAAGLGEGIIRDQLYHSGQETNGLDYRYAVHYDYTDHDGAHLGNIPTGAISIREDIIFPEAPMFHNVPRPDSVDMTDVGGVNEVNGAFTNAFCVSCHDDSNPAPGMRLAALELSTDVARNDPRRQPVQALRRVFGSVPANWIGTNTAANDTAGGFMVDRLLLGSRIAVNREVHTLSLLDGDGEVIEGVEPGDLIPFDASFQIRANLDASHDSVRFEVMDTVTLTATTTDDHEAPYLVNLPADGNYNITATPFTFFPGSGTTAFGQARTVDNVTVSDIPIGKVITLQSADDGWYVNVDGGQGDRLEATVTAFSGDAQRFEVVDAGSGNIALRSISSNAYVSVNQGITQKIMYANGVLDADASFEWIVVDAATKTVRLRNVSNGMDVDHIGTQEVLRARFQDETSSRYQWIWAIAP